jgi:HlyD family secretion protein
MKLSRRVGVAGAVVLVAGLAWPFLGARGRHVVDPAKTVAAEKGTMVVSVVATGKIQPVTTVEVKSKANGIIERLHADVDQVVDAGQVLAELDRENLTAQVREARANLAAAEAARDGASAELKKNQIEAESPEVELARHTYARAEQLFAGQLASRVELEQAKSALDQAENRARVAVGQIAVAESRVTQATANVAQARAAVDRADEQLANATIRAPIRATVLTRDVEVGSPVSSILNLGANATLVMTLGDIEKVFVKGKVDESDIGKVRVGQPARITTETFRERVFDGRVTQISPIGVDKDNVTTFAVEVSIDNPGKALKANMTANAEIVLREIADAILVPEAAVTYDAGRHPFVDLVDPAAPAGRRRVAVEVGAGNGSKIQILRGIQAGDRLVLPG